MSELGQFITRAREATSRTEANRLRAANNLKPLEDTSQKTYFSILLKDPHSPYLLYLGNELSHRGSSVQEVELTKDTLTKFFSERDTATRYISLEDLRNADMVTQQGSSLTRGQRLIVSRLFAAPRQVPAFETK